jgi:hypothetical protein
MLADTGAGLTFVVAPKRTRHRQSKDLEKAVGIERYGAANSRFPVDQLKTRTKRLQRF